MSTPTLALTDPQRRLLALLGDPLSVAQLAQRLGVSDKRVYQLMGQLRTKGYLRHDLPPDALIRTVYPAETVKGRKTPAAVRVVKLHLFDGTLMVVQGTLLDDWHGRSANDALPADKQIAIRDMRTGDTWSFVTPRRYRWSVTATQSAMGITRGYGAGWCLTDLVALTLAIARVLGIEALIVPAPLDLRETPASA